MQAGIGGILGAAAGLAAWLVGSRYRRPAQTWKDRPRTSSRPADWGSAVLVSAGMAAWGIYASWRTAGTALAVSAILFSAVLVALALVDVRVRRLPNPLLLALLGWGLVQALWLGRPSLPMAGLGLLAGGGLFFLVALTRRSAMGAGDVKLAAVLGAVLGYPLILPALLTAIVAAGIVALVLIATRRAGPKDYMAYGPYLALGAWIVWTWAAGIWQ